MILITKHMFPAVNLIMGMEMGSVSRYLRRIGDFCETPSISGSWAIFDEGGLADDIDDAYEPFGAFGVHQLKIFTRNNGDWLLFVSINGNVVSIETFGYEYHKQDSISPPCLDCSRLLREK